MSKTDRNDPPGEVAELLAAFPSYFRVELASGDEQREELYRLRYEVYCREFGFEREADCPGGRETDAFDGVAWHALIRHLASGRAAGSVRIIEQTLDTDGNLPLLAFCRESLDAAWRRLLERGETSERICEVSRLAVPPAFRRRSGEDAPFGRPVAPRPKEADARTFPLLTAALAATAVALAFDRLSRDQALMMMEPRLHRSLRRLGLDMEPIGRLIHYHGRRAPYRIGRREALASVAASPVLRPLHRQAVEALQPQPPAGRDTAADRC